MRKETEYQKGREDGLDLALRIVHDGGVEALEKEIKFRNITGINTSLASKDLNQACEKIKECVLDAYTVLSIAALHDVFGFGQTRCQRYMEKLNEGAGYIADDLADWSDYIAGIKEQIGLELDIRWKD